jgi:hypothetical protein
MSLIKIEKVIYTARAHTAGGRDGGCPAAPTGAWTLNFQLPALAVPHQS